jgi:hypothetical protein
MGLPRKLAALLALQPDIAVLSEVACPSVLRANSRQFCELPIVWIGDNLHKGLAVISFTGRPTWSKFIHQLAERPGARSVGRAGLSV